MQQRFISVREAVSLSAISESTIRRAVRGNEIMHYWEGERRLRISERSFRVWARRKNKDWFGECGIHS